MLKAYIHPVKLRKWFPPDDPLAATVARLCILREDLFLEMLGMETSEIEALDRNTHKWRQLYFLRNSIRTLFEIRSAIETLQRNRKFRELLKVQPQEQRNEFQRLLREFTKAHGLLKDIRDSTGGHVPQARVQAALNEMSFDREDLLEVGQKSIDTHYRFVGELLVAILLIGVPEREQKGKIDQDLSVIANLMPIFALIDNLFVMYVKARELVPMRN
jgi:hypothetical protein